MVSRWAEWTKELGLEVFTIYKFIYINSNYSFIKAINLTFTLKKSKISIIKKLFAHGTRYSRIKLTIKPKNHTSTLY